MLIYLSMIETPEDRGKFELHQHVITENSDYGHTSDTENVVKEYFEADGEQAVARTKHGETSIIWKKDTGREEKPPDGADAVWRLFIFFTRPCSQSAAAFVVENRQRKPKLRRVYIWEESIMKRQIPSFLAGAAATVLLTALCTTALAASGKITYNASNVSLDGETRITAGTEITAQNGQKVPGPILYTDPGGRQDQLSAHPCHQRAAGDGDRP